MALDFSAGSLVRSGSYIVLGVLGALLLARRRGQRWNAPVGAAYIASGVSGIIYAVVGGNNGFGNVDPTYGAVALAATTGLSAIGIACWLFVLVPLAGPMSKLPRAFLLAAILAAVVAVLNSFVLSRFGAGRLIDDAAFVDGQAYNLLSIMLLATLAAATEGVRRGAPAMALWFLLLPGAVELALYTGAAVAVVAALHSQSRPLSIVLYLLDVLASLLCVAWLLRGSGRPRSPAVPLMLALLGTFALSAVATLGFPRTWFDLDASGTAGVLLAVADLGALYGMLRFGLLGGELRGRRLGHGALASVALAGLFITAQVAQNFLGAQYGVYVGGVVAGVVVFAASPIQRAVERTVERSRAGRTTSAAQRYRRQVELAWADGKVGTKERLMLAEAREALGLDAGVAHTIEDEVAAAAHTRPPARRP